MTTKHTPGPWRAEGWENLVVNAACGSTILARPGAGAGATLSETKANARLIAAAPEMLEALERIETACAEYVKSGFSGFAFGALTQAREQARAAIAKAKGQ